jgi:hypothetical protein
MDVGHLANRASLEEEGKIYECCGLDVHPKCRKARQGRPNTDA